jgi:SAM-dependent methyltransferase
MTAHPSGMSLANENSLDCPELPTTGPAQSESKLEYWELIARTTRWGRYLAKVETDIILRGDRLVSERTNAVDLGCGGGRWSRLLADRGWNMTCVDVNPDSLHACRQKLPEARCVQVTPESTSIPCETRSQRMILCMEAPDVIEGEWFIPEAMRVIEPGGVFIGFYMNPRSWRGLVWRSMRTSNWDGGKHYSGPPYSTWRKRFLSAGFEMIHQESCSWAPFGRTSNSPLIPLFTRLERWTQLHRLTAIAPWVLFVARKKP